MRRELLLLLFFCSSLALATSTQLKLYRPFGAVTEQVRPVIKKKMLGHCFAQSRLIVREEAWRCQAEGVTYDPCFVRASGPQVMALCPQSPWVGDSVLVVVKKPLKNEHHVPLDMSSAFPWAVELVNGDYCRAIDSSQTVDGLPVRYQCNDQHVLVGHLQRCQPVWRILEKTSQGIATMALKKAWF